MTDANLFTFSMFYFWDPKCEECQFFKHGIKILVLQPNKLVVLCLFAKQGIKMLCIMLIFLMYINMYL